MAEGARRGEQGAAGRDAGERRRGDAESLRLRSLSPALTVDDLPCSLEHYVDGLGFTVRDRWEEEGKLLGVMLVAGSVQIGLSQDDWSKGRDRSKGIGSSLYAQTAQDLEALAARCRARGIEVDGPKTESWGARTLTVIDPDGFKLVLTPPE
jgi:uncharacterized glyoxalase superfamily protein PhnB